MPTPIAFEYCRDERRNTRSNTRDVADMAAENGCHCATGEDTAAITAPQAGRPRTTLRQTRAPNELVECTCSTKMDPDP